MYTILKPQSLVPKALQDQFSSHISIPLDMVTVIESEGSGGTIHLII